MDMLTVLALETAASSLLLSGACSDPLHGARGLETESRLSGLIHDDGGPLIFCADDVPHIIQDRVDIQIEHSTFIGMGNKSQRASKVQKVGDNGTRVPQQVQ